MQNGVNLDRQLSNAGRTLMGSVDRIAALVDQAIVKTQSDLQSIPAIINGLAGLSAQFTPTVPKSAEGMTGGEAPTGGEIVTKALSEDELDLKQALQDLKDSSRKLSLATRRVALVVESVRQAAPLETLKLCGVAEVTTGLRIQPSDPIVFTEKLGGNKRLIITGGEPFYIAELAEHPVDGLTVSQPVPFGSRVVIEAKKNAPVGTYSILITDAANHVQKIPIIIEKAPDKGSKVKVGVTPTDQGKEELSSFLNGLKDTTIDFPNAKGVLVAEVLPKTDSDTLTLEKLGSLGWEVSPDELKKVFREKIQTVNAKILEKTELAATISQKTTGARLNLTTFDESKFEELKQFAKTLQAKVVDFAGAKFVGSAPVIEDKIVVVTFNVSGTIAEQTDPNGLKSKLIEVGNFSSFSLKPKDIKIDLFHQKKINIKPLPPTVASNGKGDDALPTVPQTPIDRFAQRLNKAKKIEIEGGEITIDRVEVKNNGTVEITLNEVSKAPQVTVNEDMLKNKLIEIGNRGTLGIGIDKIFIPNFASFEGSLSIIPGP